MNLSGQTALVTGATGGLGQAIARALAARGVSLVLTGRRAEILEPFAKELGAQAHVCDLSKPKAVTDLAELAKDIDILVCNAALPGSGLIDSFTVNEIDRVIAVNLRAPMILSRLIGERMMARRSGHIVFISSLAGKVASPRGSVYSATKFGLRGFAFGLREDLHPLNVGVSVISPGFVRDAGMFHDAKGEMPPFIGTSSPEDVSKAVIRAIEHDRAEIAVAPPIVRAGGALASMAPGLLSQVQRRLGASEIADKLAAGQREKR